MSTAAESMPKPLNCIICPGDRDKDRRLDGQEQLALGKAVLCTIMRQGPTDAQVYSAIFDEMPRDWSYSHRHAETTKWAEHSKRERGRLMKEVWARICDAFDGTGRN